MEHPGFFERAGPFSLRDVARAAGADIAESGDPGLVLTDVRSLSTAGSGHLSFFDNRKYIDQLADTAASACLLQPGFSARAPKGTTVLTMAAPYQGFARVMQLFYPDAMRPKAAGCGAADLGSGGGGGRAALVHPSAVIEDGAVVEPGAVVGVEARIGRGTTIAAGALVGYRVHVGRGCYIGPGATLTHALLGDRVILHAGVRVGQDGFGFAMAPEGNIKVPQIGRVIIQDDVEIGANSCVDRGGLNDTIIGEGTKIDDLVMVGHNVVIGRHCVLVSQSGVAGSAILGDFVVMGGRVAIIGHIKVGDGAQIGGWSWVKDDVPAGAALAGTPARPFREWARVVASIRKLGQRAPAKPGGTDRKNDN